ncbi:hypothetical protein GS416_00025 [Rhodococcus hoagii]|nr:hypothetical protein [Prescottella equi]
MVKFAVEDSRQLGCRRRNHGARDRRLGGRRAGRADDNGQRIRRPRLRQRPEDDDDYAERAAEQPDGAHDAPPEAEEPPAKNRSSRTSSSVRCFFRR